MDMARKTMETLTESMFYVLMALKQEPMCGIDIATTVEKITDHRVVLGPATLYTVLARFEKEGYIREIAVSGRKRTYEITPVGLHGYEEEIRRLQCCLKDAMSWKGVVNDGSQDPYILCALSGAGY